MTPTLATVTADIEPPGHQSSSVEVLSFAMFCEELRRAARFITAGSADPLAAALQAIQRNPALPQSRLITRILEACAGHGASFRRAEVSAFDREHLTLLTALMNARDNGSIADAEWTRAADLARREIED